MTTFRTIDRKGRLTLPLEVRQRLGLKQGDQVEFALENDRTILRPASSGKNPFEAYLGSLPAFSSQTEINAWIRDLRGDSR